MSSTKSRQRLFMEKVSARYPGASINVRCDVQNYIDTVSWSVYCSNFPDRIAPFHWTDSFASLDALETWFEAVHSNPLADSADAADDGIALTTLSDDNSVIPTSDDSSSSAQSEKL